MTTLRYLLFAFGLILLCLVSAQAGGIPAALNRDQCFACHQAIGDEHAAKYPTDVHAAKGISCADCHGGDRTVDDQERAMDKRAGFIGVPKKTDIPSVCARCHEDPAAMQRYGSTLSVAVVKEYRRSVHGEKLSGGDATQAQCVTCHGVHSIKAVNDPSSSVYPTRVPQLCSSCHANAAYMKMHNPAFPIDQHEKYRTSVHGQLNAKGDPKAATCVSCHKAHDIISGKFPLSSVYPANIPQTCARCHSDADYMKAYKIPTDQYEKYAGSVHGVALLEKKDIAAPACNSCHGNHGATPPGVADISNICGTCHALNAQMFSQSPHKKAFDDAKMPECETCHSNHAIRPATITMLGVGHDAVCVQCHSEGDKGYLAAAAMRSAVDTLLHLQGMAETTIGEAEQKGMEVSEARFALKDVRQALIQARTIVHTGNMGQFNEVIGKGSEIVARSHAEGEAAIDEYYFRRKGLGVATLLISLVAVTLYVKLRRKERGNGVPPLS